MGKIFLIAFLILILALACRPVKAQEPEQDGAELYVIVLRDANYDGLDEGVGAGTPVYIRESGSFQRFVNYTDNNSSAGFLVDNGVTYIIEATPSQTRLFYVWVCFSSRHIDEDVEHVILYCAERFFIRLPWTGWG